MTSAVLEPVRMGSKDSHRTARLRLLVGAINGGTRAIGEKAGVSPAGLDQVLAGTLLPPKADGSRSQRKLGHETVSKIETAYNLGEGWFDGDRDLPSTHSTRALADVNRDTEIPEYDTGGKMGHGLILQNQPGVIRKWVVSQEWVQKNVHRISSPHNLAIVTGFGDSMKGVFNPGDPLLIDQGIIRADIDGIYFFRVGEEGFVKRLQRIPTENGMVLRAKSENKAYDPFDITKGMDFEIFGRVVKAWQSEDF